MWKAGAEGFFIPLQRNDLDAPRSAPGREGAGLAEGQALLVRHLGKQGERAWVTRKP